MNDLEKMIMEEISTLDEMRLVDILGFIRFLKSEKPEKQTWIEEWFEQSLISIREREVEFQITPEDIRREVQKRRNSPNG
ncbi:MAG TPA: hypothetical protein PK152_16315 [Anaerolineales bacterium]|jgi:hypothetical protein|nr:hypothetical protein [Anaerolineae bacterium]HRJ55916.1 hypothetical protein [Anaerolineales bacterium]HRK90701.1 hypothetical protein [Anaerolineales bacterium]